MTVIENTPEDSYERCIRKLFSLGRFGIKPGLDIISNLLAKLGNPQNQFRSVHIAGTNGKGSTAAFTSSILISSGIRTGMFTSPHLVRFNERITIDGVQIADSEIVDIYEKVKTADTYERPATFFEYATAMAFLYFAENSVETAVIEAGMGGRLDCTNVIYPEVSVITSVSMDHEHYLGNALSEIASEKAGIIKSGIPVVTSSKNEIVLEIMERTAFEKKSRFYTLDRDFCLVPDGSGGFMYSGISGERIYCSGIGLRGAHQIDNAALSLAVCGILGINDRRITSETSSSGIEGAEWPGRLEYVRFNPDIILDGAHNPDSAEKLADYLRQHYAGGRKLTMIIGMMADKDQSETLRHLTGVADRVVFTSSGSPRAEKPENLRKLAANMHGICSEVYLFSDVRQALAFCLDNSEREEAICIAGSLYIVGEAKAFLEDRKHQTAPN